MQATARRRTFETDIGRFMRFMRLRSASFTPETAFWSEYSLRPIVAHVLVARIGYKGDAIVTLWCKTAGRDGRALSGCPRTRRPGE